MTSDLRGIFWCCTFLMLDAVQAVFCGGIFQRMDSFLIGAVVFGLPAAGCILWTAFKNPDELLNAVQARNALVWLNVTAAGAWLTYLIAIQLIEPAVAFTIFSGVIPIAAATARHLGVPLAPRLRNAIEVVGYVVLAAGMIALACFTLLGWSGFVRGGVLVATAGLSLAALAGVLIAGMLLAGYSLNSAGVGPVAQFGLRFPLYVVLALTGFALGIDDKGPVPLADLLYTVLVGLAVLAFPIYAVQKAISLTSPLTIGAFAAVGPLVVFLLQMVEGRVHYSSATLVGLMIYFTGALIAAYSGVRVSALKKAGTD
jgi:drug/metabolite transporter (DMT)-like permease